jgi:predicted RecB family nuclease
LKTLKEHLDSTAIRSIICADDYVAYCQCPRKAYLLLIGHHVGQPHEYAQIVAMLEKKNAASYISALAAATTGEGGTVAQDIGSKADLVVRPTFHFRDLVASPDALLIAKSTAHGKGFYYEPLLVAGTRRIEVGHKNRLNYIGHVLAQIQSSPPARGFVIAADGIRHSTKLDTTHRAVESVIATLRTWTSLHKTENIEPRVLLNDNCPCCAFRVDCEECARQADDLSLLDRITPKALRRYHKKGIFTVNQLSYVFRPRRSRKFPHGKAATFNVELQALAIRAGKIYLQQIPTLSHSGREIFLDIEGVPDRGEYYLFGVLVSDGKATSYHPCWADDAEQESAAFASLVDKLAEYPDAPIYHYGRYEKQALVTLEKRHGVACDSVRKRLVNISASIYGKVYFPVRSNNLKELGRYLGATWSSTESSGLQSLVWRHHWETSSESCYKQMLLTYNEEDCRALLLLTNELTKIAETADSKLGNIDFADRPKHQCTEVAGEIHDRFDAILKFASADYPKRKISLRTTPGESKPTVKKSGAPKGHQAYQRIVPDRAGRVVRVRPKRVCPKHKNQPLLKSDVEAQKTVIDLVFSRSGCRKTVTRYVGPKAYCKRCKVHYNPPSIGLSYQLFGRGYQAWAIHQRIVLRLPYRVITQCMEDLFGERTTETSIVNFMKQFAIEYAATEKKLVRQILDGPFVHVDETRLNIQGTDHYVWVFTDGRHVFFRLTESRESTIVHEVLSGYEGVLISDFYPGYDGVECKQQKCWVHLIRDINDDLWKAPGDQELELFVGDVRNLIMPIFETVERYGVKRWHLGRFLKSVDRFYKSAIFGRSYSSECVLKYQKRFERYREELFLFLQQDGLPWNNNAGERAIRQLAVQRKISGTFFKKSALHYLLLLGIAQTCRFQEKSFLKFLVSGEKDVDRFKASKRKRISKQVFSDKEVSSLYGSSVRKTEL